MKKRIVRYAKHIVATFIILGVFGALFGLYHGASLRYGEDPTMMKWDKDGPYVFYNNDSTISVHYIRGNQTEGFYVDQKKYSVSAVIPAYCYFPLDMTGFEFNISNTFKIPENTYQDTNKILAISDIESGFKTFIDFLISNNVVDKQLNWIFGTGHLVLLGDFVDRDFSATQVLWLIYKLEQDAILQGGNVHFILGNHELKNMQGNYESTSPKYYHISSILEKTQLELYSSHSFLGRWMATKNTIELINGTLFTHGGISPQVAAYNLSLDTINQIIQNNYYKPYYPKPGKTVEQLLTSSKTGIAWYRGYFKDNLSQQDVEAGLAKFNANAIVVGHTLQAKVNSLYNGKVIGIDVKHPRDYSKSFPNKKSEGLLIEKGKYYRILHNGKRKEMEY